MPSLLYGNTTTSASRSSLHTEDARSSRRHNQVGPSRTRLASRHNPYATTTSQQDLEGSTLKGQRRNRREGCPKPSVKRPSATNADVALATPNRTWEGAPHDTTYLRSPESTPEPEHAPARASTTVLPLYSTTSHPEAQSIPLDEFGLYSSFEYDDNYGSNFFDSFNLGRSASYPEQTISAHATEVILRAIARAVTPLPEAPRPSAGKIHLSTLHHKVMRSKGCVPDTPLDQLDGAVRQQILRQADRMMFEHQAQFREQRKWRGYREPEDNNLLKRPKRKVRFNPCSTEGRNKKRPASFGVDELARQVNRFQLSA